MTRHVHTFTKAPGTPASWIEAARKGDEGRVLYIAGASCVVWISQRPFYCDRGHWLAHIECFQPLYMEMDAVDLWPRYYMDLNRGKAEVEDWMRFRREWVEGVPGAQAMANAGSHWIGGKSLFDPWPPATPTPLSPPPPFPPIAEVNAETSRAVEVKQMTSKPAGGES
jgi:hypothetical protein